MKSTIKEELYEFCRKKFDEGVSLAEIYDDPISMELRERSSSLEVQLEIERIRDYIFRLTSADSDPLTEEECLQLSSLAISFLELIAVFHGEKKKPHIEVLVRLLSYLEKRKKEKKAFMYYLKTFGKGRDKYILINDI